MKRFFSVLLVLLVFVLFFGLSSLGTPRNFAANASENTIYSEQSFHRNFYPDWLKDTCSFFLGYQLPSSGFLASLEDRRKAVANQYDLGDYDFVGPRENWANQEMRSSELPPVPEGPVKLAWVCSPAPSLFHKFQADLLAFQEMLNSNNIKCRFQMKSVPQITPSQARLNLFYGNLVDVGHFQRPDPKSDIVVALEVDDPKNVEPLEKEVGHSAFHDVALPRKQSFETHAFAFNPKTIPALDILASIVIDFLSDLDVQLRADLVKKIRENIVRQVLSREFSDYVWRIPVKSVFHGLVRRKAINLPLVSFQELETFASSLFAKTYDVEEFRQTIREMLLQIPLSPEHERSAPFHFSFVNKDSKRPLRITFSGKVEYSYRIDEQGRVSILPDLNTGLTLWYFKFDVEPLTLSVTQKQVDSVAKRMYQLVVGSLPKKKSNKEAEL